MVELIDTQNEPDARNLAIDRVGVKSLKFPVTVRNRDGGHQSTIATVSLAVDLPHHFKGTHMSRFVEVLNSHGSVLDVQEIEQLPRELLSRLEAGRAQVRFEFPFFRSKAAPVTELVGVMDYETVFEIDASADGEIDFLLTVKVPVTTLCPCSKAISAQGAHNQRGLVTYSLRSKSLVWIEEMIDLVESSASCELYSLLKRPDEKEVTERAYENPVFVEDLVRNVAAKTLADPRTAWFRVEAENFESIHNHNAHALIERDLR